MSKVVPLLETLFMKQFAAYAVKCYGDSEQSRMAYDILNKTFGDKDIEIKILSPKNASMKLLGSFTPVKEFATLQSRILISIPKNSAVSGKTIIQFGMYSNGKILETVQSAFIAP